MIVMAAAVRFVPTVSIMSAVRFVSTVRFVTIVSVVAAFDGTRVAVRVAAVRAFVGGLAQRLLLQARFIGRVLVRIGVRRVRLHRSCYP